MGLSPSGCPIVTRGMQLHVDHYPDRPHGPLDVANAHSDIRRRPIVECLIQIMEKYPEDAMHRRHLQWNLAHYASGDEHTHIMCRDGPGWPEHPFLVLILRDALSQGDGVATPTFDAVYTLLVIRPLKLIFPPRSIDVPLIHDDTTIAADTYRHPRDDPDGTRLRAAKREDVARLIETAAIAVGFWAAQIGLTGKRVPPRPLAAGGH